MMGHMCKKCSGICSLITGALFLVNAFVWPQWLGVDGWMAFIGLLLVLGGFVKLVMPNNCPGCNMMGSEMKAMKMGKGKK